MYTLYTLYTLFSTHPLQFTSPKFYRPNPRLNPRKFSTPHPDLPPRNLPKLKMSQLIKTTQMTQMTLTTLTTHSSHPIQLTHSNSPQPNFHGQTLPLKLPKFSTFWPGPSAQKFYTPKLDPHKTHPITPPFWHHVDITLLFPFIHFSNAHRLSSFQNTSFYFRILAILDFRHRLHANTQISLTLSPFLSNPISMHPPNPGLSIHTFRFTLQNFHTSNQVYKYFQTPIFQCQTYVKNWRENSRSRNCLGAAVRLLAQNITEPNHEFPNLNFQKL